MRKRNWSCPECATPFKAPSPFKDPRPFKAPPPTLLAPPSLPRNLPATRALPTTTMARREVIARSHETASLWRAWPASGGLSPKEIERSRGDEGPPFLD